MRNRLKNLSIADKKIQRGHDSVFKYLKGCHIVDLFALNLEDKIRNNGVKFQGCRYRLEFKSNL